MVSLSSRDDLNYLKEIKRFINIVLGKLYDTSKNLSVPVHQIIKLTIK